MTESPIKLKSILIMGLLLSLGLLNFFGSCTENNSIKYRTGYFPDVPVNFTSLNSVYDDFNSGPPPSIDGEFNFYYSSNKSSSGKDFNIETALVRYSFDQHNGTFSMSAYESDSYNSFYRQLKYNINSSANELGPYFSYSDSIYNYLFYSNDLMQKQQICCLIHEKTNIDEGPYPINILNSMSNNNGYVTIDSINHTIYFMSDRDGSYDIFQRIFPTNTTLKNWLLQTSSSMVDKVLELSTVYDDKCPYINGKLMVFCSNREGGYGGFDLWYSILENGTWSQPFNFGPKINTSADEYRPVVMTDRNFGNDLMIFSSNRAGGMGGYDLYYVGIPKMTK